MLLEELERIDGECSKYGIDFVAVEDNAEAQEYGVHILPALIYFEDRYFRIIFARQYYRSKRLIFDKTGIY